MKTRSLRIFAFFYFLILILALSAIGVARYLSAIDANQQLQRQTTSLLERIMTARASGDTTYAQKLGSQLFADLATNECAEAYLVFPATDSALISWSRSGKAAASFGELKSQFSQAYQTITVTPGSDELQNLSVAIVFKLFPNSGLLLLAVILLAALLVFVLIFLGFLVFQAGTPRTQAIPQRGTPPVAKPVEPAVSSNVPAEQQPKQDRVERPAKKAVHVEVDDAHGVILDPELGISRESFLKFRLEKELARSTENAFDLSVAIVRYPEIGTNLKKTAAQMVREEFTHEDLIFSLRDDSFAIILPQHDLDQAIARVELLMRRCDQLTLTEPFASQKPTLSGLSSRNGRIMDAGRFIKEASIALKKANESDGRIVGFRPDPLRYRHFLKHYRV